MPPWRSRLLRDLVRVEDDLKHRRVLLARLTRSKDDLLRITPSICERWLLKPLVRDEREKLKPRTESRATDLRDGSNTRGSKVEPAKAVDGDKWRERELVQATRGEQWVFCEVKCDDGRGPFLGESLDAELVPVKIERLELRERSFENGCRGLGGEGRLRACGDDGHTLLGHLKRKLLNEVEAQVKVKERWKERERWRERGELIVAEVEHRQAPEVGEGRRDGSESVVA